MWIKRTTSPTKISSLASQAQKLERALERKMEIELNEDRIRTFLKVKPNNELKERPSYNINDDKTIFSHYDSNIKSSKIKSTNFTHDKIFTNEANSYIYEEVCRNALIETTNGQNYCFVGAGVSKTGKKSILIGKEDSKSNINSRGLLFRFVEQLLNFSKSRDEKEQKELNELKGSSIKNSKVSLDEKKPESLYTFKYSFFIIYLNKYLDLSTLIKENNFELSQSYISQHLVEPKVNNEITNELKQLPLRDLDKFINQINSVLNSFVALENEDLHYYSRCHFVVSIHLNKAGRPCSNATFLSLASSQKIHDNPTVNIYLKNQFQAFATLMGELKLNGMELMNKQEFDNLFSESKLNIFLKNRV